MEFYSNCRDLNATPELNIFYLEGNIFLFSFRLSKQYYKY